MSDIDRDNPGVVDGEESSFGGGMHSLIAALPEDHILRVLVREHDVIRRWLEELESAVVSLEGASAATRPERLRSMIHAVERMTGTDPHHRREEDVVYPACCNASLDEVVTALEGEHAEIKQRLAELGAAVQAVAASPTLGVDRILSAMRSFRFVYDNHMYKEDRVVFPLLAGTLRDEGLWRRLSEEALGCGALLDQDEG